MQSRYDKIKEEYLRFERSRLMQGKFLMRMTEKGFWGVALMDDIFKFFQDIHLEKYKHFLDLGSGDGRVVAIASLFTKATGIEYDNKLINVSKRITAKLDLDCKFTEKDYLKEDLGKYDFLYIYPDNQFRLELERNIFKNFTGRFFVYNNIYIPSRLRKLKTTWINQMPIIEYSVQ